VQWLNFAARQDILCLSFPHFPQQPLKWHLKFYLYSCKNMKRHHHALNLSKKYEIVAFWESHKHLSQKDMAQSFGIPTSTLKVKLKN
jgi:hypothetical protein